MNEAFLPMSRAEMDAQGISQCDFIVVTPDAYVDHPSFAMAIVGRFVQSLGFSVGVIAQPDWKSNTDFLVLGAPKYAFLVSGGNMDGVVGMYTASKHLRREDDYSPDGAMGLRPVRPTIAYTAQIKSAFKDAAVIVGGVEASNRRFAHYDYLEDKVRRSYLVDSKADLLVYGMGERPLKEICERLRAGERVQELTGIRGTCILRGSTENAGEHTTLPSFERTAQSKKDFADAFRLIYTNASPGGKTLVQAHGDRYLIQYPPAQPLNTPELDAIYNLPFIRRQHPSYKAAIPALQEVQFSITALRGCPAQCAFCSISAHQGKRVMSRSKKSVVEETRRMAAMPEFKGIISDVGGPTANFYGASCSNRGSGSCTRSCTSPKICEHLRVSHKGYCELLEAVERVPGVRRVFIRSGIRYDYLMADKDPHFMDRLVKKHVSGQLKVAPEHVSDEVLQLMNKPSYAVYERFATRFSNATKRAGKPQFLLPYYISSHPGSTLDHAIALAQTLKKQGFIPEQVQDFYPTPGTLSTCIYYTGLHPLTGKPVYVANTPEEKAMQRALLQFNKKQNWPLIRAALLKAGREDLIGQGKECLVPPGGKPDSKLTGKTDSRPGAKAGSKLPGKPASKPANKLSTFASGKPGGKMGRKPDSRSSKPDSDTMDKPASKPSSHGNRPDRARKADIGFSRKPESGSDSKPSRPTHKSGSNPSGRVGSKLTDKPDGRPMNKSGSTGRPSGKPSDRPDSRQDRNTSGKPGDSADSRPSRRPDRSTSGKPGDSADSRSSRRPDRNTSGKRGDRSDSRPSSRPDRNTSGKPSDRPDRKTGGSSGKPDNRPSSKTGVKPVSRPGNKSSSRTDGRPNSRTGRNP